MPVMDEFKEEREALKHGTFKEKISYFYEYYRWHVIATVAIVAFVISMGYQILTRKDTVFYAAMINGTELESAEEYIQNFAKYAEIDLDTCNVVLDASMSINLESLDEITSISSEKLVAQITARNLDVIVTDSTIMEQNAYTDTFLDLRDFLSEEQYAKYQPYFYYIDQAVLDEKYTNINLMDNPFPVKYPDPRNPDAMEKPIPVGIYLEEATTLREHYYYTANDIIFGVVGNTKRAETTSKFLDFIMQ